MDFRSLFIDKDKIVMANMELGVALNSLDEAIVLNQLNYWIERNKDANRNFRDGHYWIYNSYEAWRKQDFPVWSATKIKRIFTSLESKGIVLSANYNKLAIDKTKWYTIDYDKLKKFIEEYTKGQNEKTKDQDEISKDDSDQPTGQNGQPIGQNDQTLGQSERALPDTNYIDYNRDYIKNTLSVERAVSESEKSKPETKKTKQQSRKKEADALFEQLWSLYPLKKGKASVSDAQKLKLLDIGYEEMERAISRYKQYVDSVDYLHCKNGSTFFNSGYVDYLDENYVDYSNNNTKKYNRQNNDVQKSEVLEQNEESCKSKLEKAKQKAAEMYGEQYREEFWEGMEDGEIQCYLELLGIFLDEIG